MFYNTWIMNIASINSFSPLLQNCRGIAEYITCDMIRVDIIAILGVLRNTYCKYFYFS